MTQDTADPTLAQVLRDARVRKGITIPTLAASLSKTTHRIYPRTLEACEEGTHIPSYVLLEKLATALDLPFQNLLRLQKKAWKAHQTAKAEPVPEPAQKKFIEIPGCQLVAMEFLGGVELAVSESARFYGEYTCLGTDELRPLAKWLLERADKLDPQEPGSENPAHPSDPILQAYQALVDDNNPARAAVILRSLIQPK